MTLNIFSFLKKYIQIVFVFASKQAKISANGVRKIILIQRLNKIIFLTPLADIFTCFKQKLTQFGYIFQKTKQNILFF